MHARPTPAQTRASIDVAVALGLALACLALYLPVRMHGFIVADDGTYVAENPHVRAGLGWSGVAWAWTTFRAGNWHPLTWLSHMADVTLFGLDPGRQHLAGAVLHGLNMALLYAFLVRTTRQRVPSVLAAALVAFHPLRVESVAWIAERKDLLAGLFCMLALHAYVTHARRPSARSLVPVAVALGLGLLAKPMLVTLPLVLLLLDRWPLDREDMTWRHLAFEKLPLAGLAVASSVITLVAQSAGDAVVSLERAPLAARVANASLSALAYIRDTLWPRDLAVHYPFPARGPGLVLAGALAAVVLAVVTTALMRRGARDPAPLVGWAWYLVTLLPVIGLVQVGTQARADRYTYLPSIGLAVVLVWGARSVSWGRPRVERALAVAAVAAIVVLVPVTRRQLGYWRDSVTLFSHAVAVAPADAFSRLNLGVALADSGRVDDAERELLEAARLAPDNPRAHFNLGNVARRRGDITGAESSYRAAIAHDPSYPDARVNLGLILYERGALDEARVEFCRAATLEPDLVEAAINCANVTALAGNDDGAIALYRRALALEPRNPAALLGLAGRLLEMGRADEGLAIVDEVVATYRSGTADGAGGPSRGDDTRIAIAAHLLRARELDRRGRRVEAEESWREILRLAPDHDAARRRLGMSEPAR